MTTRRIDISNRDDHIDIRHAFDRVVELEGEQGHEADEEWMSLTSLLEDCEGYGGDEQWRGDWYPATLIRDSHFQDYARELAEETSGVDFSKQTWPLTCIDWQQAARELQMDYTAVEFGGVTYWTR